MSNVIEVTGPADPPADSGEGQARFAVGEACGVCRFPVGPGQICGNTVYANVASGGALPKYCGQAGQAEWQAQHGTEGNPGHLSDRAGYPRRRLDLTKDDVARLALAEAARRGIGRRSATTAESASPATTSADAAPVTDAVAAPAATVPDLAAALPESAVDALAELARLIAGRVVAMRAEMDGVRTAADERVAQVERAGEQLAEELAKERAGLESDRAEAQAARERAESEIREAREAQLVAEGQLREARQRITELEQASIDAGERHRGEIAEVRQAEEARYDKLVAAFAATTAARESKPARRSRELSITDDGVREMALRIERGEVTWGGDAGWLLGNAKSTRPGARTLDHMATAGYLDIGEGEPGPVTLSEQYRTRDK
ncbi:hypothetical protein [Nocardia pseudovaccinii]|nr:hypothetical protein [Nocardia pseudovaccinii]